MHKSVKSVRKKYIFSSKLGLLSTHKSVKIILKLICPDLKKKASLFFFSFFFLGGGLLQKKVHLVPGCRLYTVKAGAEFVIVVWRLAYSTLRLMIYSHFHFKIFLICLFCCCLETRILNTEGDDLFLFFLKYF